MTDSNLHTPEELKRRAELQLAIGRLRYMVSSGDIAWLPITLPADIKKALDEIDRRASPTPSSGDTPKMTDSPKASTVLNCVSVWLTEAEMEWLETHGKVRIERDVVERPAGFIQAYTAGGTPHD